MPKLGQMAAPQPGAPMAAPQPVNLGALAQMGQGGAPQAPGFLAGILGPQGSQPRYDAVMALLQNAQSSAGASTNPLLSFLTPIATAMIGAKATNDRDTARAKEVSAMTETLLGPTGMSPAAQNAISVLQNPDAPDYLKAIAKSQFDAMAMPRRGGRAAKPVMSTDQAAALTSSLLGDGVDPTKLNAAISVLQDPNSPSWLKAIAKSQVDSYGKPPSDAGGIMPLENTFEDPPLSDNWYYLDKNGVKHRTQRGANAPAADGATEIDGYQIQEDP